MKLVSSNTELKKMVGVGAADLILDGMRVGIGTGSTVAFFIMELGRRIKEGLNIQGVATSYQSRLICSQYGIPLIDSMLINHLDIAVDGADEIDPSLNAIKGGGAAHTIENANLKNIPGLLETGLFLSMAKKALVSSNGTVKMLLPKG